MTSSRTLAHLHHPLTLMRNGHPRRLAPSSGTSTPRSYAPLPSSRLVKLSCDIMAAGAAIPAPTATHRATAEGSSGAVEAQLTSKADVKLQPVIPPTPLSARSAKNDADARSIWLLRFPSLNWNFYHFYHCKWILGLVLLLVLHVIFYFQNSSSKN